MERIDDEAVLRRHRARKVCEELHWHRHGCPTAFTDQVAVGVGCEVVGRGAVTEMGVHQHTESLEFFQIPIDGRPVDRGVCGVNFRCEFIGGSVPMSVHHCRNNCSSSSRHPSATATEVLEDCING